jgi:hypothetical protein
MTTIPFGGSPSSGAILPPRTMKRPPNRLECRGDAGAIRLETFSIDHFELSDIESREFACRWRVRLEPVNYESANDDTRQHSNYDRLCFHEVSVLFRWQPRRNHLDLAAVAAFAPSTMGTVSRILRDLTILSVVARNFLKCGVSRCFAYASASV